MRRRTLSGLSNFGGPAGGPPQVTLGVSGVAVKAGRVLLVQRGTDPYLGDWSLPGGKVNPREPHQQALIREFREETGLEVTIGGVAGTAEAVDPAGSFHYLILSYFVTAIGGTLQAGDDAAGIRWVSREELPSLRLTPGLEGYLDQFGVWNP